MDIVGHGGPYRDIGGMECRAAHHGGALRQAPSNWRQGGSAPVCADVSLHLHDAGVTRSRSSHFDGQCFGSAPGGRRLVAVGQVGCRRHARNVPCLLRTFTPYTRKGGASAAAPMEASVPILSSLAPHQHHLRPCACQARRGARTPDLPQAIRLWTPTGRPAKTNTTHCHESQPGGRPGG